MHCTGMKTRCACSHVPVRPADTALQTACDARRRVHSAGFTQTVIHLGSNPSLTPLPRA